MSDKITAEQVVIRCAELGFTITKPGFAQYLADICNEPIRVGPVPVPIFTMSDPMPMYYNQGWLYR